MSTVEASTGGDPMSQAKYLRRSLATICDELHTDGIDLSPTTVARLLAAEDFRLRVNAKRLGGAHSPERDEQFTYLQEQLVTFFEAGLPIISVDTKKKELVGNFPQAGTKWCRRAELVNDHTFPSDAVGKAVPYGVYDLLFNHGLVTVGLASDTPAFAVAAIQGWWVRFGCKRYRGADELLILADAGGSNGCHPRAWKRALQEELADRYGLAVTVCHYPPGASKWNPIEHRLFGPISTNWAGEPLRTLERLLGFLRGTHTTTGLEVAAVLDLHPWSTGEKVSKQQMAQLHLQPHSTYPQWNYTIRPRSAQLLN